LNVAFKFVAADVEAATGNTFAKPLPLAKWSLTCAPELGRVNGPALFLR